MIEHAFPCPYCGQANTILMEPAQSRASLITDCAVCCRPIAVEWELAGSSLVSFRAKREND